MFEYDFRTYSLGFSPFTKMLDKYMFSPCQQLLTGIAIRIMVGERSKVTSLTVLRLETWIISSTFMTSSDFVPRIMATSVPLPPRPARLVTTVYNSPQLKEVSSIQRLGPMFCLNRTYSVAWSNWSHCLYALINSLYCEVNCFPLPHKHLQWSLC